MAKLPNVKDDAFDSEVLKSTLPVLVDFSAEWCGPCRALAPTLEALAQEFQGRVKFVKVDIDEARSVAERFNIASVPTMILFKSGDVVTQALGNRPRHQIVDLLNEVLGA